MLMACSHECAAMPLWCARLFRTCRRRAVQDRDHDHDPSAHIDVLIVAFGAEVGWLMADWVSIPIAWPL
jgi:hypothetical protein